MNRHIGVYRRLFGYLRPVWKETAIAYTAMLAAVGLALIVPQIIARAIDQGVAEGRPAALFRAGGVILAIAVVRGAAAFAQRYYGEWLTHRVAYDLRDDFYEAVQRLPFAFHDAAHTGDLMSRATSDISETERFVGIGLADLLAITLQVVGVVLAMFLENARLALLAIGPIVVMVAATLRFGFLVRPMFRAIQTHMGDLSTQMQESLTGIGVVKAFAREPYELAKFDEANEHWFDLRRTVIRTWGNNWPFLSYLLMASIFLLLWFGGPMALAGQVTVGSLFALISYVLLLNGPAQRLGMLANQAATAGASAGRVFEIIERPSEIVEKPDAHDLGTLAGRVAFEKVSFAYRGVERVLHGVDFVVEPGQTVALIGPTGSGKSTIINLLPRFYDPTAGRITVDGMDIRDVTLRSLRRQIGMVLQNPFLFSSTIAENIAYGRPGASQEEIEAAARAANAHEFIVRFPDGYATMVGERGVTLSGGQRQRVAIARALLPDPRILILDDSTSSVDTETEYEIQQALAVLMRDRTTFIIAQRLLTLKQAGCIFVLDDGRIVQRGRHEELLEQGGLYRRIYDLQLRDQEELQRTAAPGRRAGRS